MNTKITDDVRAEYRAKAEEAYGRHYYAKHGAYPESAEGIYAERFISNWLCEQLALQRQREPVGEAVARVDDLERGGRVRALALGLSLDAPLFTTPPSPSRELLEKAKALVERIRDGSNFNYELEALERALLPQEPKEEGKS